MDPDKIKATWDQITKQIKLSEDAVRKFDDAQQELLTDFTKAAQQNVDYYKEVLSHLTAASKEGTTFDEKMKALGAEVDLTSKKMQPIVDYLKAADAGGKDFTSSIRELKTEFVEVRDQAGKTAELMDQLSKSIKGMGAGALAGVFSGGKEAMKSFQKGFGDLAKIDTGELSMGAGLAGGMSGLLGGLEALRAFTEPFRRGWADVNKQVLDVNSNVGKLGEYTDSITRGAGDLAGKYNLSLDQIMKLDVSLAKIGSQHDNINDTADGILTRYKAMPSLTPEKQVDMMAQYMSRFGMSSTQAGDALGKLFTHAQGIKDTMGQTNISAQEFLERSQSLEVSSRSMGYNFGEATATLEIMGKLMQGAKGEAIDWEGATKATQAVLSIGQGNMGMQAYMMEQFTSMKGASVQGLIGGFALDTKERAKGQVGMMENMMQIATPTGKTFETMTKEERAGDIMLAFKGLGISLNEQQVKALTEAMRQGPEHFHKAMLEQTKIASDLQDKQKESDKNMGVNVDQLVKVTTTMEDSVVGLLGKISGTLIDIANHFLGGTVEERNAKQGRIDTEMRKQFLGPTTTPYAKEGMLKSDADFYKHFESEEGLEELKKTIETPVAGKSKAAQMMRAMEVQVYFKAKDEYESKHQQLKQPGGR